MTDIRQVVVNAHNMASERCRRIFCLAFSVVCLLLLSSCGLKEKGAEKLYDSGTDDLGAGDLKTAENAFSQAIDLDAEFAPAYLARARVRFGLKDFTNAESDCSAYIKLESGTGDPFLIRGLCEYQLKDLAGASNDFNTAISLNPQDGQARLYGGVIDLAVRDWDGAVTNFSKAIEADPNNALALHARAGAEAMLDDYEKAVADASVAIGLNDVQAYAVRAHAKSHLKDRAGAIADAEQIIQLKPSDAEGFATRASIEILWDDFAEASNDLQTAVELSPTNLEARVAQGILDYKSGNIWLAGTNFSQVLAMDPNSFYAPDVYEALGHIKESSADWNGALDEYRKGLAFNNPPEGLHFYIFLIEHRLGQTQEAQKELKAYLQSIPPVKTNDWTACTTRFLLGDVSEPEFISEATSSAKRPTDVPGQTCDADYYSGMMRLLAGDKTGASEQFQKSVNTKEDNCYEYMEARNELKVLKSP